MPVLANHLPPVPALERTLPWQQEAEQQALLDLAKELVSNSHIVIWQAHETHERPVMSRGFNAAEATITLRFPLSLTSAVLGYLSVSVSLERLPTRAVRQQLRLLARQLGTSLQAQQLRYQNLLIEYSMDNPKSGLLNGVWEYNALSQQIRFDNQINVLLGLSSTQPSLSLQEFTHLLHPQDRLRVQHILKRSTYPQNGDEVNLQYRIRSQLNEHYYWVNIRTYCQTDNSIKSTLQEPVSELRHKPETIERLRRINHLLANQNASRRRISSRQRALQTLNEALHDPTDIEVAVSVLLRVLSDALEVQCTELHITAPNLASSVVSERWPALPFQEATEWVLEKILEPDALQLLSQGQWLLIDNIHDSPYTARFAEHYLANHVCSFIAVPWLEHEQLQRVIVIRHHEPRSWSDDELAFIQDAYSQLWSVSERLRAERALQASDIQFHLLADNICQFAWTATPEGKVQWYNKRWYDYTGLPQHSLISHLSLVHPEHQARIKHSLRHAVLHGLPWEDSFPLRGQNGQYRWFLCRTQPIFDQQQCITQWFGTHTDITMQVSAEAALRELNDLLEVRVTERTHELSAINHRLHVVMQKREHAEKSLRHAQRMEAIGHLTGGLAHDFNNMLTGVLSALDLLSLKLQTPEHKPLLRFIDAATGSAKRAAGLTHRMLAFARKQSLDPQVIDSNQLIESMIELLQRTLGESISLKVELEPALWPIHTDHSQLENSLLNLIINSRDAMPTGGTLSIQTRNCTNPEDLPAGGYIAISVTDTGMGIPQELLSKIFDPYFTTKPLGQGTGLGLSMVYGFTKQSEGDVRIQSKPLVGTSITLYLPRYSGTATHNAEKMLIALDSLPQAVNTQYILVVEDDPSVRTLLLEILNEYGYQTLEADNAYSALELLSCNPQIELLVTDIGLSGMSGRELASQAQQALPNLKVLLISGYAPETQSRTKLAELGMDLLAKPFSINELIDRTRHLLKREQFKA